MTTILPPAPVTVMTATEIAAQAARLTTLTISPEDRARVLDLLRETCEALAAVTTNIANDVVEETPAGGTLGSPDWMPAAGRLVMELSHMGDYLCAARDGSEDAVKAVEDIAAEQADRTPERVATFTAGPGLSPDSVMYVITYTMDGQVTAGSYARPEDLDSWRTDLTAAGWTVVDAEPAEELVRPSAAYATPEAQVLLVELKARLTDAHGVTR